MTKEHDDVLQALGDMNEAIGNRFDKVDRQVSALHGDMDRHFSEVRNQLDRIKHRHPRGAREAAGGLGT